MSYIHGMLWNVCLLYIDLYSPLLWDIHILFSDENSLFVTIVVQIYISSMPEETFEDTFGPLSHKSDKNPVAWSFALKYAISRNSKTISIYCSGETERQQCVCTSNWSYIQCRGLPFNHFLPSQYILRKGERLWHISSYHEMSLVYTIILQWQGDVELYPYSSFLL